MLLAFLPKLVLVHAHGGDEHTRPEQNSEKQSYFSSEAVSEKYELLLRYGHIEPGEPAKMTLFLSEYASNKPVDSASIQVKAKDDAGIVFTLSPAGEGAYTVEGTFPAKKSYSLLVSINSPLGADLILLKDIETGKELPLESKDKESLPALPVLILIASGILLLGIVIGFLLRRKNTPARPVMSVCLLILYLTAPAANLDAHAGHDEKEKESGSMSAHFTVPKETQFLFDVYTEKLKAGSFTESSKLFGTIIPSSNGQALVSSPQNGNVITLNVLVGQQVKAGQQLAVIEQNIDAGTRVSMLAEKNNLQAEFDAAKKEYERLKSIDDIAAKRDLDEAKARFQKASDNLKLLSGTTGKTIVLTAPISGVVANFNLSPGSTINAGQTLFTITNLSKVYAEAQVFDKDAEKVKEGARFTIECSNDNHKTGEGEVRLLSLAQSINATNQSQRVLFELSNPGGDFKIGEFVNIRVFAPVSSNRLALPNSAISEINGKPVVFIKDAAEQYSISYVQLGENNGSYTTILRGIEEGERVVVNGSYQLKMIYLNQ